jgi:hypothetical protein
MATQAQMRMEPEIAEPQRWNGVTRVAFRVGIIYLGLYGLTTQIFGGLVPIPGLNVPELGVSPPVKAVVFWTAAKVFGVDQSKLVFSGSGSGDKTYDWVLAFCALVVAVAGGAVWSVLDRRRRNYAAMYKWFYAGLRFALGSQMLLYGMIKVVPLQMPFPSLTRLVEPYGNFSPMGVLWYSIGASPAYETFVGAAEMLGGILLFFPRTTVFGAMVCLADAVEVFTLNMTYDVPVKQFSFHLIVMSLVLLGPEMRRLACFFFTDRGVEARVRPKLFVSARKNRVALAVQVVFGLALIANNGYGARESWSKYGGGAPKSVLYGIWNVEGASPWRRVIFDRPTGIAFQKMDDTFASYVATIDAKAGTIAVAKGSDKNFGKLTFGRAGTDALTLDGTLGGDKVHLQTRLLDRSKLMLVSRGFHWVQEYPFNR